MFFAAFVGDVHRIAQQSHELEIQRCDDGANRRLESHNRPKQTAVQRGRKNRPRAKSSKTARNAANREMIGRTTNVFRLCRMMRRRQHRVIGSLLPRTTKK